MNLMVELQHNSDGWARYGMITGVKENKVILNNGEEIDFEKLKVKKIEFNQILFSVNKTIKKSKF